MLLTLAGGEAVAVEIFTKICCAMRNDRQLVCAVVPCEHVRPWFPGMANQFVSDINRSILREIDDQNWSALFAFVDNSPKAPLNYLG